MQDPSPELWGYIDPTGKVTIDFQFREAGKSSEGQAVVEKAGGRIGFIDTAGTMNFPLPERNNRIMKVTPFSDELAWVSLEGSLGPANPLGYYIDRDGKLVWSNL